MTGLLAAILATGLLGIVLCITTRHTSVVLVSGIKSSSLDMTSTFQWSSEAKQANCKSPSTSKYTKPLARRRMSRSCRSSGKSNMDLPAAVKGGLGLRNSCFHPSNLILEMGPWREGTEKYRKRAFENACKVVRSICKLDPLFS